MGVFKGGYEAAIRRHREKLKQHGSPRLGVRLPKVELVTYICAGCGVSKTIYPRAGRKTPTRCRSCDYRNRSGEANARWKGGITPESRRLRNSERYKQWSLAVFERDKYTCVWCGQKGWTLHADHIKPFSTHPDLRFDLANGRTLCVECHKKTSTYLSGAKGQKPRVQAAGGIGIVAYSVDDVLEALR